MPCATCVARKGAIEFKDQHPGAIEEEQGQALSFRILGQLSEIEHV